MPLRNHSSLWCTKKLNFGFLWHLENELSSMVLPLLLLLWGFEPCWEHFRECSNTPSDIGRNQPLQADVKATSALSKFPSASQQLVKFWPSGLSRARTIFSLVSHTKESKQMQDFSLPKTRTVFANGGLHTTWWWRYRAVLHAQLIPACSLLLIKTFLLPPPPPCFPPT